MTRKSIKSKPRNWKSLFKLSLYGKRYFECFCTTSGKIVARTYYVGERG